jgi:ribose 5-phosphate isomerase B
VGRAVVTNEADFGIVLGGSGQGEQIAANKIRGVRAALCLDLYTARMARAHNDANVLSLGGRIVAGTFACSIVDIFLSTSFDGGRHRRRIEQITEIEREECEHMEVGER